MENEKRKGTDLVPSPATAELIPEPTAELIENPLPRTLWRNRRLALKHFQKWLQGREISDELLAEYITYLFDHSLKHSFFRTDTKKKSCNKLAY